MLSDKTPKTTMEDKKCSKGLQCPRWSDSSYLRLGGLSASPVEIRFKQKQNYNEKKVLFVCSPSGQASSESGGFSGFCNLANFCYPAIYFFAVP